MEHFLAHPGHYLFIPFFAALVGWLTNALALRMLFHPVDFLGLPPHLGWQGVLPRSAEQLTGDMAELAMRELLSREELFDQLDIDRIVHGLELPLRRFTDEIIEDVMLQHQPELWTLLPDVVKNRIKKRVAREIPDQIRDTLDALRENLDEILDVRALVTRNLKPDRSLLINPFLGPAAAELAFIRRSGLLLGFACGLLQAFLYLLFGQPGWLLPVTALVIGVVTNAVAVWLLLNPAQPTRFGPFRVQGLVHRRHAEIIAAYSRVAVRDLLSARNILREILLGNRSERLRELVVQAVNHALDERSGLLRTYINLRDGEARYLAIKRSTAEQILAYLPDASRTIEASIDQDMNLGEVLTAQMRGVSAAQFVEILRPALHRHAWALIGAGALAGLALGLFQTHYLLAGNA